MKLITKENITTLINGIKEKFYSKREIDEQIINHTHNIATNDKDGWMSKEDKEKLDTINGTATIVDNEGTYTLFVDNGEIPKVEIIDNLTSTDTDKGLSANQGKILNEKIIQQTSVIKIGDDFDTAINTNLFFKRI